MTGPIQHIITTIDTMITAMDNAGTSSANMFSPSDIHSMHASLDTALAQVNEITDAMEREESAQRQVNNTIRGQNNALSGVIKRIGVMAGGYLGLQGIIKATKTAINFSDELTNNTNRLNLMNGSLRTTEELQNKIFNYANDARTSYSGMMTTVAALGQRAGNAFNSNDETIQFVSNLAKEFAIAGASQEEQASATLQLTQALGSGVLRGEELNAVFEAAPNVIQTIADYLEVPIGQIRSMASNGEITADIVKNAMLGATDSINKSFKNMNLTFGQRITLLANSCQKIFEPVGQQINNLVNSPGFTALLQNATEAFQFIADVASNAVGFVTPLILILNGVFDTVQKIGNFISENWSIIAPIIWGIIAALIVYSAKTGVALLATAEKTVVDWLETAAIFAMTLAQDGLNAAFAACPLTWIIILIIALIAIIFAVCAAIAKFTGVAQSAFGVICGAVATAGAFIWNLIVGVINGIVQVIWSLFVTPFLGIVEWILNVCNGGFDSFGDAVANLIGQVISWFLDLGKVVTKIIDAIFGTDWTGGLNALQDDVLAWGKNEKAITVSREAPEIPLQRIEYGEAWNAGATFGDNISNAVSDFVGNIFDVDKYIKDLQDKDKDNGDNDTYAYDSGGNGTNGTTDKIAKDTSTIADNTAKTTDILSLVKDNMEREIVAKYTSGNNVINDFSGMINNYNNSNEAVDFIKEVTDYLSRKHQTSAEGV